MWQANDLDCYAMVMPLEQTELLIALRQLSALLLILIASLRTFQITKALYFMGFTSC